MIAAGPAAAFERPGAGPRVVWATLTLALALGWTGWIARGAPAGPACLLRELAHVDCPTCGLTRALVLLARGEWRAALVAHPWAPALVGQLLVGWASWTRWLFRGGANPERWIPLAVAVNAGALLVIWCARLATGTLP